MGAIIAYSVVAVDPRPALNPAATVSIAEGSFLQGCEAEGICYLPHDLTILEGTTVTWTNDDTEIHTVTSGASSEAATDKFDSGIMEPGDAFEYTFESAGTYEYHCAIHPWAKALITVR